MSNYYLGPYDIKVHNSVPIIPSVDGVNFIYNSRMFFDKELHEIVIKDGLPPLTENEYKTKFCYKDGDDYWYSTHKHTAHNYYIYIDIQGVPHITNLDGLYQRKKIDKLERKRLKEQLQEAKDCSCAIF